MSQPVVVTLPHKLGKDEAVRRLKSGMAGARNSFGGILTLSDERWTDNRLEFNAAAMGQAASGIIDVGEDSVRIEVTLPWLLAKLAEKAKMLIQRQSQLMLEKK